MLQGWHHGGFASQKLTLLELLSSIFISTPVIASGGISSIDDLHDLKNAGRDLLFGVISGRAIYDGAIDPAEAVAVLLGESDA